MTIKTLTFDVHGMTCGGCTSSVKRALGYQVNVHPANVARVDAA